jgi:GT2 family glycosyltransferase
MFSIVIVNYDGARYLPECLQAIRRQTYTGGIEIVVVNNRSTDGSLEFLRRQKDVRLIDPGRNTGFSRGQNLGIHAGTGEYVLCLNFDCFLEPDFLDRAAEVFRSHADAGGVSGRLRKLVDGKKTEYLDSTGISFHCCFPAERGEWAPDDSSWQRPGVIFGPSGAAACYQRAALESVRYEDEYFDEDFFLYCEDIDLAWRLNLAGWRSYYEPAALAYHERGSTRKESTWERRNYFITGFRNRLLAMYKNLRWREDVRRYWPRLLWQEVRFALGSTKGGLASAWIMAIAVQKALSTILAGERLRQKRRFIQGRLRNPAFDLGFDRPLNEDRVSRELNLYELPSSPAPGATIVTCQSVQAHNLAPSRSQDIRGALAGGVSRNRDPQFIIPLPEHARSAGTELLEFDLYASDAGLGQIIWLRGDRPCISEGFRVHPGRRRYLLDLQAIGVLPNIGDPAVRSLPIDSLRIDPCVTNGVTLGLFGARLLRRQVANTASAAVPPPHLNMNRTVQKPALPSCAHASQEQCPAHGNTACLTASGNTLATP